MPNLLRVSYRLNAPKIRPVKFTLRQKFGNHTIAFVDYEFIDKRGYVLPPEGTPFSVQWGTSPAGGTDTFYGYVNHYETVGESGKARTRLVGIGTSKKLETTRATTWTGTTPSAIARDLARRYRLRSVVHAHPWVLDNWASGPLSDWRALMNLAQEAGYLAWVDGSTLYFLDPEKVVSSATAMTLPVLRDRSLRSAQVLGGSNVPGYTTAAKRRIQYGLDYSTNEFFEVQSGTSDAPTEMLAGSVTTFAEAASRTTAAAKSEGHQFATKVRADGNARIRPGQVLGIASGRVATDLSGVWLVHEATHTVSVSDFETAFEATRGTSAPNLSRVRTTLRSTPGHVGCVVRDGANWEAVLQEHVHA